MSKKSTGESSMRVIILPFLSSPTSSFNIRPPASAKRCRRVSLTTIDALGADTLFMIFTFLDLVHLIRCSAVCHSWRAVITKLKLLQLQYHKQHQADSASVSDLSNYSEKLINIQMEQLAMGQQRSSLQGGHVSVFQWKAHSVGFTKCRMKMGLILTGVGDKVMRLWSAESCKGLDEYQLPDRAPLIDFNFDEGKIEKNMIVSVNSIRGILVGIPTKLEFLRRPYRDFLATVTTLLLHTELSMGRGSGIKTMCLSPNSYSLFCGSSTGYASCWDLRTMRRKWETRVSPNVLYSMQHLRNDASTLVIGGIDGVVRIVDQGSGNVLSRIIMENSSESSRSMDKNKLIQKKKGIRLTEDDRIDLLPNRLPITCLAAGMQKVVTAQSDKCIRVWKFGKKMTLVSYYVPMYVNLSCIVIV
ncbi:F-box/WD-40 repeat-containing protein At3g52030-like [Salvia splendens]|nr:F-box/WD-40 repeat-containing protein At3g52030-like [Salvia splendens]